MIGSTAINGSGNILDNTLIGNNANNALNGDLGNDSLSGGAGKDTFLFNSALDAKIDSIEDFVAIDDIVKLDQTIFSSLTTLGTLAGTGCFRSSETGAAADTNDYILYNRSTGARFYDADGSGTTAPSDSLIPVYLSSFIIGWPAYSPHGKRLQGLPGYRIFTLSDMPCSQTPGGGGAKSGSPLSPASC